MRTTLPRHLSLRWKRGTSLSHPIRRYRFVLLVAILAVLVFCTILTRRVAGTGAAHRVSPAGTYDAWEHWYQGGFAGKKVVLWGNSTVSHANVFLPALAGHAGKGGELEGLRVTPEIDNRSGDEVNHNGPIHALGNIENYGNYGAGLRDMLDGNPAVYYHVDDVIAAHPDLLIIRGPLINDIRMGATSFEQAKQLLSSALDRITRGSPHTAILLVTENSLLSSDQGGYGFVRPNSAAQKYTDIMHDAVMAMKGRYPQVRVYDLMSAEYGIKCLPTSPLMHDQLHPSNEGQRREADLIAHVIGKQTAVSRFAFRVSHWR